VKELAALSAFEVKMTVAIFTVRIILIKRGITAWRDELFEQAVFFKFGKTSVYGSLTKTYAVIFYEFFCSEAAFFVLFKKLKQGRTLLCVIIFCGHNAPLI
jgi:hypothetical protein